MRLFKTEMLFPFSPSQAARPRYGGRGPRIQRTLAEQPVCSASICILGPMDLNPIDVNPIDVLRIDVTPMDPEPCACRRRDAAWLPTCEMGRAA